MCSLVMKSEKKERKTTENRKSRENKSEKLMNGPYKSLFLKNIFYIFSIIYDLKF